MNPPLVFLTGFGAFEAVSENPSGRLVAALRKDPPRGVAIDGCELPVTFRGSAVAFDAALAGLEAPPDAILALGVHIGSSFRIERGARARLRSERPDNDGETGAVVQVQGAEWLATRFDIAGLLAAEHAGGEWCVSNDAGGYVCEHIYRHALACGERLGVPALFLHVPPLEQVTFERQVVAVRSLLVEMTRSLA